MSTIIDGAEVAILADTGRYPFILDFHRLDAPNSFLTPTTAAVEEITCDVLHAQWNWGSEEWAGPLTMVEAGTLTITLHDPDREYDPANPSGTPPLPGSRLQVTVDGLPAWTGHAATVSHSLASGESVITGHDAIANLSGQAFLGFVYSGTTMGQYDAILTAVGWDTDRRVRYGAPVGYRTAGEEPAQAWPALARVARAELGTIWCDRVGRVAFRSRGLARPPVSVLPVIGCEGAEVDDVGSLEDRVAIVDHVVVEADETNAQAEWSDDDAIRFYGKRTLRGQRDELRLIAGP